jgi:hypothetical protein
MLPGSNKKRRDVSMRTEKGTEGGVCKSFALLGSNGYNVVLSETCGRQEIDISIQRVSETIDGGLKHLEVATARISGEQFQRLCRMDSSYDGLEVRKQSAGEEPSPEAVVQAALDVLDEDRGNL